MTHGPGIETAQSYGAMLGTEPVDKDDFLAGLETARKWRGRC